MKNTILTIVFLIGLIGTTFANNGTNKRDSTKTNQKELTQDQKELLNQLEEELTVEIDIQNLVSELEVTISKVVVYDMEGNVIHEQSGTVDFNKLPKNANSLMTEGTTKYYLAN